MIEQPQLGFEDSHFDTKPDSEEMIAVCYLRSRGS